MASIGRLVLVNDSKLVVLGKFGLSSRVNPGCEEEFFYQLNPNGSEFVTDPMHEKLMELQHAVLGGRCLVASRNQPRLFSDRGRILRKQASHLAAN
jgi:hypothetical protein